MTKNKKLNSEENNLNIFGGNDGDTLIKKQIDEINLVVILLKI